MDISIVRPLVALRDGLPRETLLAVAVPTPPNATGQANSAVQTGSPPAPDLAALTTAALAARATALTTMAARGGAFGGIVQSLQAAFNIPATPPTPSAPPTHSTPPIHITETQTILTQTNAARTAVSQTASTPAPPKTPSAAAGRAARPKVAAAPTPAKAAPKTAPAPAKPIGRKRSKK